MRKIFLLVFAILSAAILACGQDSPPLKSEALQAAGSTPQPVNIDPAKEADIRKLLDLVGTRFLLKQTLESLTTSLKPVLTNSLPPGEYRAKLVDLFFATFLSRADPQHMLNLAVPIYDKSLSHQEIKDLIRFYESLTGQKYASVLPHMTAELQQAGQKWGEELGRQTMKDVLAEHPDLAAALEEAAKAQQR